MEPKLYVKKVIEFGIEGGLGGTLMVLTGVNAKDEILVDGAPIVPKAYVDKLGDILPGLQ